MKKMNSKRIEKILKIDNVEHSTINIALNLSTTPSFVTTYIEILEIMGCRKIAMKTIENNFSKYMTLSECQVRYFQEGK